MDQAGQHLDTPMTVARFLAWDPPGNRTWQLVDGTSVGVNARFSIRVPDLIISRSRIADDPRWNAAPVQMSETLDSIGTRTPPRDFDRIALLHPGTAA